MLDQILKAMLRVMERSTLGIVEQPIDKKFENAKIIREYLRAKGEMPSVYTNDTDQAQRLYSELESAGLAWDGNIWHVYDIELYVLWFRVNQKGKE